MRPAFTMLLCLGACVSPVRPTAIEILGGSISRDELANSGFENSDVLGTKRVDDADDCIEKASGGALYGVEYVRVCYDDLGDLSAVFSRNTHGRGWHRLVLSEE